MTLNCYFFCMFYGMEDESHFYDLFSVELKFQYVVIEAYCINAFCVCSAWLSNDFDCVQLVTLYFLGISVKNYVLLLNSLGLSTASLEIVDPGNGSSTGLQ